MTWKIVVGSLALAARPLAAGRTLAWYAQRVLERPEGRVPHGRAGA
ncbi:MAG TPA: hypothetical protein VFN93_08515 [Gaiellaceae bacterium]|nr:hypothetical protein [Gaiellaceae bacterium]